MLTYCKDCGRQILEKSTYCHKCYLLNHNPMGPGKKEHRIFWKGNVPRCIKCHVKLSRIDARRCKKCARQGNLHPNYIDGRTDKFDYPREFLNLKMSIRERDDYICQNCDMTEEEHLSVLGSALEIHHIDYIKTNNKTDNLITLCKQCNVRANYNRSHWLEFYRLKMREVSHFNI